MIIGKVKFDFSLFPDNQKSNPGKERQVTTIFVNSLTFSLYSPQVVIKTAVDSGKSKNNPTVGRSASQVGSRSPNPKEIGSDFGSLITKRG
jgi:hypothetical protein